MQKKYLTVDQAQQRLPTLRRILRKLAKLEQALTLAESIEVGYEDFFEYCTHQTVMNKSYHKLWFDYYKALEKSHGMGAIVKDVRSGMVDFFSIHEGREILLCWNYGEPKIRFWHELDDETEERKPISLLKRTRTRME